VHFESIPDLLEVLTPQRYRLLETVQRYGRFESITALAALLKRERVTVRRDLRVLADKGLVHMRKSVHPGHGQRTEVVRAARRMVLELVL
jgi:predicted transcriptional regulator